MAFTDRKLTIAEKVVHAAHTGEEAVFFIDPPFNAGASYTFTPEGLQQYFYNSGAFQGTVVFETQADFESASIGTSINTVTVGTGPGNHRKQKMDDAPDSPEAWHSQSADGAWWVVDTGQFITPEIFGAVGDETTNDRQAFIDAMDFLGEVSGGGLLLLCAGPYRIGTTLTVSYPITFKGLSRNVQVIVDNSTREEGFLVNSNDVVIEGFTILANSEDEIINGSGNCGTCITIAKWFVDPLLPEPQLVKNIVIRDMTLTRYTGSEAAHAIAIVGRSSHVLIENCDIYGRSPDANDGYMGDAVLTHWGAWSNGVSTHAINYDAQTGNFTEGQTLIGSTSGAHAYIVKNEDSGTTGTLRLKLLSGNFQDNEILTDGISGVALANGTQFSSLVQSKFYPDHYSHHPNNVRIRNIRCRNVGRVIACSASYAIDVDGVDYEGPVQGGQLVDLPVGDEAGTFAHPDDYGQVHTGFSFKNFRANYITGTGSNAVTAIDCSGYNTSKQSLADLAGYADTGVYNNGETYAGRVQLTYRQPEWKAVEFENFVFDYGPADPPSATDVLRIIWIRNVWGRFSFKNFHMVARANAPGDPEIASITLANNQGDFCFENMYMYGRVEIDSTDTVTFKNCEIHHSQYTAEIAVEVTGSQPTGTTTAVLTTAGSTTLTLSSAFSGNLRVGDRLNYTGGQVYVTDFAIGSSTTVYVTPLPVDAAISTVFTVDHRTINPVFENCNIWQGNYGYSFENCVNAIVRGGQVSDTGQYGAFFDTGCEVTMDGTLFRNNGKRRALVPADAALSTRDLIINDGIVRLENIICKDGTYVVRNLVVGTGGDIVSVRNCQFLSTSGVTINSLSNGKAITWVGNVDETGAVVFRSGTWTAQVLINASATGITTSSSTATYTVYEDRVHVDFNITLSSKGASVGAVTISGLPFTQAGQSVGTLSLKNATGLTGSINLYANGGVLNVEQWSATGTAAITDTSITNTTQFIGSIVYRRSA